MRLPDRYGLKIMELLRYGSGSLIMLMMKLGMMEMALLFTKELVAYAIVQIFVFFGSYLLHSKFTFKTELGWNNLIAYLKVIVVFQVLDWVIFAGLFSRYNIESTYLILMATGVVFIIRYSFVRRGFRAVSQ